MFGGQLQRRAADFAVELAERDQRAGKSYGADEDAQIHFDQMDGVHIVRNFAWFDIAIEADQNRRQADEAVQERNQLGHFGHFYFFGFVDADGRANQHGDDDPAQPVGVFGKHGNEQGDRHSRYAGITALFGGFLLGQPRQREDEQYRGYDVRRCNES